MGWGTPMAAPPSISGWSWRSPELGRCSQLAESQAASKVERAHGGREDAPGDVVLGSHLHPNQKLENLGLENLEPCDCGAGGDMPAGGVALGSSCTWGGL